MSMSIHVVGFQEADDKWKEMKAVWDSCETAGVEIPKTVLEFFGHEDPADKPGREIDLDEAVSEWSDDCRNGYEIKVSDLPQTVSVIRFYCSW